VSYLGIGKQLPSAVWSNYKTRGNTTTKSTTIQRHLNPARLAAHHHHIPSPRAAVCDEMARHAGKPLLLAILLVLSGLLLLLPLASSVPTPSESRTRPAAAAARQLDRLGHGRRAPASSLAPSIDF
jgi:hypothetical protein